MPKRKSEDKEDKIKKKIRRLERRLEKYRAQDVVNMAEIDELPAVSPNEVVGETPDPEMLSDTETIADPILPVLDDKDPLEPLPDEVLKALGEDSMPEKGYGEEVHKDICKKMDGILLQGLEKDQKEKLMKTCLVPSNARLLDAPKLNSEVMAILNTNTKNRDKLLESRQQELGLAAAGVLYAIDGLSKNDFNRLNLIKLLGDGGRFLCNLHCEYTNMRKKLIFPYLDKNLSLNLRDNIRSEFLYTKLEDTVKTVSVLKRASIMLKPKHTPATSQAKNFYQPPRRPFQTSQAHPPARGGYHYQPRYQPRPAYRPPPRGQPRRPPPSAAPTTTRGRAKYP